MSMLIKPRPLVPPSKARKPESSSGVLTGFRFYLVLAALGCLTGVLVYRAIMVTPEAGGSAVSVPESLVEPETIAAPEVPPVPEEGVPVVEMPEAEKVRMADAQADALQREIDENALALPEDRRVSTPDQKTINMIREGKLSLQ